jgi:hypothetical protein
VAYVVVVVVVFTFVPPVEFVVVVVVVVPLELTPDQQILSFSKYAKLFGEYYYGNGL